MVKKKTKKRVDKKKVPEFKCCGIEDKDCSKKNLEVYVCPRCQSVEVGYKFRLTNLFGVIPRMRCKTCGFEAPSFPKWIIDKDRLTNKSRKVKEKKETKKRKKTTYKEEILESYCPNCKDRVDVKMKDGRVDTFICENCEFQIKNRPKRK